MRKLKMEEKNNSWSNLSILLVWNRFPLLGLVYMVPFTK